MVIEPVLGDGWGVTPERGGLVRAIRADRSDAGQRLDRVLVRHLADLPEVSRTRIQGWVGMGRVVLNGRAGARPAARVAKGDEIAVLLPCTPPQTRRRPEAQEMPLSVLVEDEHLLVVDKPAGLVVHPTPGRSGGTLLNALLWLARGWSAECRPCLVHRLDRDTSGTLLVAKTPGLHAALARSWRGRCCLKQYLALVYGRPKAARGCIHLELGRDPLDHRRMVACREGGLSSETLFEELATSPAGLTLLRCTLRTGRMHQIRVHLQARGLPLVGDPVYGEPRWKGFAQPELAAACRSFPRQALHAWRLALPHPATGAPLLAVAPLPEDFAGLLTASGMTVPGRASAAGEPHWQGNAAVS